MEYLINFDDSLLKKEQIVPFITELINQVSHFQGAFVCPHQLKVYLNKDNKLTPCLEKEKKNCECCSQNINQTEQIIRLLIYMVSCGLPNPQRLETFKQNKENSKLSAHLRSTLKVFRTDFTYYKIYENNDQELKNLLKMESFAYRNNFEANISFSILKFSKFSLKIVYLQNGQLDGQKINYKEKLIGLHQLLRFITSATFNNINFEPICIHNIGVGDIYKKLPETNQDYIDLQVMQVKCERCNFKDLCISVGNFFKALKTIDDSSSRELYSQNESLVEQICEGKIKPISFINELINPNYIDDVTDIDFLIKPFNEQKPKSFIGKQQILLEIELYKVYFIKKTLGMALQFVLDNQAQARLKIVEEIFNLQLNKQLTKVQSELIRKDNCIDIRTLEQIKTNIKNELHANEKELNFFNNAIFPPQDQSVQVQVLRTFYPQNMNNFVLENFRNEFALPGIQDKLYKFRILCCLNLDQFFDYERMLYNLKPYLEATKYQNGIQLDKFEKFLLQPECHKAIDSMISILENLKPQI